MCLALILLPKGFFFINVHARYMHVHVAIIYLHEIYYKNVFLGQNFGPSIYM